MLPKRNIAAFTLVELLIVVALVGLAIGMTVSEFGANQQTTADQAIRLIATQVDYVREMAVANNTKYTITFDTTNDRLVLAHTGNETGLDELPDSSFWQNAETGNDQYLHLAELPISWPIALSRAVQSSDQDALVSSVEFEPTGGTNAGDDVDLWIQVGESPATYATVNILNGTGLTEVGNLATTLPGRLGN